MPLVSLILYTRMRHCKELDHRYSSGFPQGNHFCPKIFPSPLSVHSCRNNVWNSFFCSCLCVQCTYHIAYNFTCFASILQRFFLLTVKSISCCRCSGIQTKRYRISHANIPFSNSFCSSYIYPQDSLHKKNVLLCIHPDRIARGVTAVMTWILSLTDVGFHCVPRVVTPAFLVTYLYSWIDCELGVTRSLPLRHFPIPPIHSTNPKLILRLSR